MSLHLPKKVQPPRDTWLRLRLYSRLGGGGALAASSQTDGGGGGTAGELRPLPPSLYTNHVASPLNDGIQPPDLTVGSLERSQVWLGGALEVYSTPDGVFYICK